MAELLTLEAWAAKVYGEEAPCLPTLQRWARAARISPRPIKHGRAYFVKPDAVYVPPYRRLIERHAKAKKSA